MRRGEYFPIYRPSQLGGRRTKPFTRPAKDSLPHHECEVPGCGGPEPISLVFTGQSYLLVASDVPHWFCSWGCLGRYSAIREIRS